MFTQALREIRFHPGRLVATLLAIALSVGFMSAVSVFMATQTAALGKMMALPTSAADLVVEVNDTTAAPERFAAVLAGVQGVAAVERSRTATVGLSAGDAAAFVTLHALPGEGFRWAELAAGSWPRGAEVAVSQQLAEALRVRVGDTVEAGPVKLTVSGITRDAPSLFVQIGYVDRSVAETLGAVEGELAWGTWLVDLAPGADASAARAAVEAAVAPLAGTSTDPRAPAIKVSTAGQAQHQATMALTSDFDVMKNLLLGFSAVAALVGLIIIANTFTILLAQRRRQIGLLRAVGASGGQVRARFLAEAVVLGLIGSLLGLVLGAAAGWVGAVVTKASWFGLVVPWPDLAIEAGVGVLLTVLAAMLPAWRATRVAPLEALQPVATSEQVRRASRWRAAITGVLFLAGVALAAASRVVAVDREQPSLVGPLLFAVAGAMLITVAVLGAAPLYVPILLRAAGRLLGATGPTARLAGQNAVRNPTRAAATATALMLATGLIVTLQIGVATAERTMLSEIDKRFPIDLTVAAVPSVPGPDDDPTALPAGGLSQRALDKVATLPNVRASAVIAGGLVETSEGEPYVMLGADPAMRAVSPSIDTSVADGTVLVSGGVKTGAELAFRSASGAEVTLRAQRADWVPFQQAVVSAATLKRLVPDPRPQAVWLALADEADLGATVKSLESLTTTSAAGGRPEVMLGGSAMESAMLQEVLGLLLLITTALLGVAVLIALIGVGNTLGLSVIERARESALLRALGMQRGALRRMLLVESLLLAGAGLLVGVAAGVFFGWLGMSAILRQSGTDAPLRLGVDWAATLGMVAVAVAAAALASVLPGRRAANATPTEALAAD
nr:ABC transporter permease [Propionibacterium sp.]